MRFIRLKEVLSITGLARASVYRYMDQGCFPKTVSLGDRAVAWVESEVQEWVLARIAERNGGAVFGAGQSK